MDTSKEYIKMCEKVEEIQEQWKPKVGDFLYIKPSRDGSLKFKHREEPTVVISDKFIIQSSHIWLPRQDQLQEMISYSIWSEKLYRFYDWLQKENYSGDWLTGCNKYHSMEQLWLAFVMKERYSKQWLTDKQDWCKI